VYAALIPNGLSGPYRVRSVRPATIVGSANGRSISELTIALPRNSSRTSIHAITVPITMLTATTISEQATVSFRVDVACGEEIASQKPLQPRSVDFATTSASGISTITLR
jgi:hypothetical protein